MSIWLACAEVFLASPREIDLRQIWKGIKFIWSPDGPLTRKVQPRSRLGGPGETEAAKLTQTQIEKAMKDIKPYLCERLET